MTEPPSQTNHDALAQPATTSIANRLLKIIFGSYFALAILLTVGQLVAEYRHTEGRVNAEIQAMSATFGPGIANAMWRFQDDVLLGILVGITALPTVVGVKVLDPGDTMVRAVGTILDKEGHPSLANPDGTLIALRPEQGILSRTFGHEFPVVYQDERGQPRTIGKWVVYSNQRVVVEQVKYGFSLIFISAFIKAGALWFIFLYVLRRWLGKPLMQLTDFVKHLDIANLGERAFALKDPGRHELHYLADTVNITAQKLHRSIEQNLQLYQALESEQLALKALNETLEQRVAQRTEQLQILNQKLAELSITDGLTAIGNRRRFDEVLTSEWNRAERLGQPLSMALLDVDWFKKYNDHYGHVAGDECLRSIARVLADHARRAGDLAARYGGEEFAIIMAAADSATALTLAQAICEAIHQLGIAHPLSEFGRVTVSLGVATMQPGNNLTPTALMNLADQALYRAKSEGRGRVVAIC